ncbi:metallophosphoesterase family protein [Parapedobacter deserti]|uniref:Metallophosphoesterase family protein n=1 Tax=Parapedobacter deserti TaxID=1912957 RepID=A0ABV7JK36_9SPHI
MLPLIASGSVLASTSADGRFGRIRFGVCTDVHQDLIPDAERRLAAFIEEMEREKPDFIIQLGDFCFPDEQNTNFMQIWNSFSGKKLHVVGNHDPEGDYTLTEVMDFWGMESPNYSLNLNGYHLVTLNGNDVNPEHEIPWKYERYISKEQLDWLESDLNATDLPTIVFCHQGLDNPKRIENALFVRTLFERVNQHAGFRKVQLVFSGHHHLDYHNVINGIHYIQINSMSYNWQGDNYAESPYPESVNKQYPLLKYMAHYKDPLWALIEIDESGRLTLTGRSSTFFGKSPQALGKPRYEYAYPVVPHIKDRQVQLTNAAFAPATGC